MRLREFNAEIRNGNLLLVECVAVLNGDQHCGGKIRVPFTPAINGFREFAADRKWNRLSGSTLDDITLEPSVDAGACGHFLVRSGEIVMVQ